MKGSNDGKTRPKTKRAVFIDSFLRALILTTIMGLMWGPDFASKHKLNDYFWLIPVTLLVWFLFIAGMTTYLIRKGPKLAGIKARD